MEILVEIPVQNPEHPEYGPGGIIKTSVLDDCVVYWEVVEVLPVENDYRRYRVKAAEMEGECQS